MKKVSLVVMEKERENSLEKLREAGVLHLEKRQAQSDTLSRLLEKKTKTDNALALLKPASDDKKNKKKGAASSLPSGEDPVAAVLTLGEEKKLSQEQLIAFTRERTRLEKWGSFDPGAFASFAQQGLVLTPYELTLEEYNNAGKDIKLIVLEKNKSMVRALAWGDQIPGVNPFALGECSLAQLDSRIEKLKTNIASIGEKFYLWLPAIDQITTARAEVIEQIEFETARAGMEILEESAGENFEGRGVSWLTGYIPAERLGILKRSASENGWALTAGDPEPDDPVPTLLKNNRFVKLLEPLTGFLEVVPGYNEIDISPFFLVFFVIFFGMIFGDAGYGILLLLAGCIGLIKTAKKGVPRAIKLLLLLGFSNLLWGVLTCSWFGIGDYDMLPSFLKSISLPLISNARAAQSAYDDKIVQQNLMIFCFSLALLQLSIGHILVIIHTKSLKVLGDIGTMGMLAGMYLIVLNLIASNEARYIPMLPPAVPLFAAGFVLNFIFANYDGSVGGSILESLKNFISVILGIANIFSDIMSYIRLWAVGLAGAAIASTINTMAGPMLGHFIFFVFGVVLLVFGHGLNLVLNMLSVLVHGVRLNTLEFSSHVGLTWAGQPYKPFAKKDNDIK
ncbi:MAG: V-type ATP synthase subunit I [Treponema sp.]|nr:V-type ATP synthase subunit I [Treponema sp.]